MSDELLICYGKTIRQIRQRKQISQEELADTCGLHRTYISDVELGKRNISLQNIEKIAEALDMTITQIFQVVENNASLW